MCRGIEVCGNRTTFGSGKIGTGCFGANSNAASVLLLTPVCLLGSIFADEFQQVLNVAFDLHLGIDLRHASGAIDHERGALDSHVLLAVEILLFVHAEHLRHRGVLVREQRKRELVLLPEVLMRLEPVGRDAKDHGMVLLELGVVVAEVAGFLGAAGSLVLGIEVEDHGLLALELPERDGLAGGRRQAEIRRGPADHGQHCGGHPSSESGAGPPREPGGSGRVAPGVSIRYLVWTADMASARSRFCSTTFQSRSFASHTQPRAAIPEALKSANHASYEGKSRLIISVSLAPGAPPLPPRC